MSADARIRVVSVEEKPFGSLRFRNAMGKGRVESCLLPAIRARVTGLPAGLGALVATGDLQGRTANGQLMGIGVSDWLAGLCAGLSIPPEAVGVLLAGDLYTVPALDRRGGLGDVRPVWEALAERFRWAAGVLGNHDDLGDEPPAQFSAPGKHILHIGSIHLDGMSVAGVGGIMGSPPKPNRSLEADYLAAVELLWSENPSVITLHESPCVPERDFIGSVALRAALDTLGARRGPQPLLVCGHCHWPDPLVTLGSGAQVLNVDGRVVVMTP